MSINTCTISGNLTRDPELRATASGTEILGFSVAVNDAATAGEWGANPTTACTGTGLQRQRTSQGNGREPRRVRDRAQATAESVGRFPSKRRAARKACTWETRENPKQALPRLGRAAIP